MVFLVTKFLRVYSYYAGGEYLLENNVLLVKKNWSPSVSISISIYFVLVKIV
jgi:hypothetical protein